MHSQLPLWLYIVIIIIGSLLLVAAVLLLWRWQTVRNRSQDQSFPDPKTAPVRKVTLRRGRLVPASKIYSLTGSKFGVEPLTDLEEGENAGIQGKRSRSPFGWWFATLQDRSQSRQSEMSNHGHPHQIIRYAISTPEPSLWSHDRRKEPVVSVATSPSIASGIESPNYLSTNESKDRRPYASVRSSKYVNFSRSFTPSQQSILSSASAPSLLPRIVEASPRHSITSKHPSLRSIEAVQQIQAINEPPTARLAPPPPLHSSYSTSDLPSENPPPRRNVTSWISSPTASSLANQSSTTLPTPPSMPDISNQFMLRLPQLPPASEHVVDNFALAPATPSTKTTRVQLPDSMNDGADPQINSSGARPGGSDAMFYWHSRSDLRPVRSPSRKGNVLRKKSLRRAEVVSFVAG